MQSTSDSASSPVRTSDNGSFDVQYYSLTIEQVKERLAAAGVPRNDASIARFCRKGELEGFLANTSNTRKYFINDKSLQALISKLRKKKNLDNSDIYHHDSSHVTAGDHEQDIVSENKANQQSSSLAPTNEHESQQANKSGDKSEHVITRDDSLAQILQQQFELRIKDKEEIITILKSQLEIKDEQIKQLTDNLLAETQQGRGLASSIGFLLQKYLLGKNAEPGNSQEHSPLGA
jgi:hypothetical protein